MTATELYQSSVGTSLPGARQIVTSGAVVLSALALTNSATAIDSRTDLQAFIEGTHLGTTVLIDPAAIRRTHPVPLMRSIRESTGLSQRHWASILGVSHTTIRAWEREDPTDRSRLSRVREALGDIASRRSDVGAWLTTSLPGLEITPANLISDGRYRALRGALHASYGHSAPAAPDELRARARRDISWPIREVRSDTDVDE